MVCTDDEAKRKIVNTHLDKYDYLGYFEQNDRLAKKCDDEVEVKRKRIKVNNYSFYKPTSLLSQD